MNQICFKMFSIRRNGLKLIKLGTIINDSKHFSGQLKFLNNVNVHLRKKPNLMKLYFERKYSTIISSETEEKEINFDDITNGDKEVEHKLKVILLEAEVMRQEGKSVPDLSFFTTEHWKELLILPSRTARRKYLEYLFKLSKKKENKKAKQLEKSAKREEFISTREPKENESLEDFTLQYDLSHNNIFLRIYDTTINQMYNNRLIQAMMFGQKLVVDCGYDVNMTKRENINCAKQLMILFAENRVHDDPFDLHYCNTNPDGDLMKYLSRHIPNLYEPSFPLNVHEASYLDLFPKNQLVYLTPHCRQEITDFDHDAVYIIGAIVDKVNNEPLSLAKAKREGLRMAKLPLDSYLQWGSGSGKKLPLNQVLNILNDVKHKGDWNYALRHVPKRKIMDYSTGQNVNKLLNVSHFNRREPQKKWVPSSNVNLKLTRNDEPTWNR